MSAHDLAIQVLLWTGVAIAMFVSLAMVLSNRLLDRLHYMAPVADVSAFLIMIAVIMKEGWGQAAVKTIVVCVVLVIMNAVLAHATARAARVREFGHWTPRPDEGIRGVHDPGEK